MHTPSDPLPEPSPEPPSATSTDTAPETPSPTGRPDLPRARDSVLPALAGALFTKGGTLTGAGSKTGGPPPLHPLVEAFLDDLPVERRERWARWCPEAGLLTRHLAAAESGRRGLSARRAFTLKEARRSLKGARLTTRRIREPGDPDHGTYQPPCRSCEPLLAHFGVAAVADAGG